MVKLTYSEYFNLFWLARTEVIKTAKIAKKCKGKPEWEYWLGMLKKDVNLAIKAKKLAVAHVAD